ncbi:type II toxin-antitoxin system HicA family toxin [Xanthobacter sp. VTT E-85241]|uniref:type II toxin-antitoxin system HicA family toxin n=1 Tax=Roseixanthobacter finlandensis TaxID=3119922 RepID=UPI003727C0EA
MGRKGKSNQPRIIRQMLEQDGWQVVRKGPGDHLQFKRPDQQGRVTLDMGAREIPTGTLRSIYRQAGWDW